MKLRNILFILFTIALCACTKELAENTSKREVKLGTILFSGQIDLSKTVPAAGGSVSWTMDDHIGIYDGTNYVMAEIKSAEGSAVTFAAEVDVEAESYIAVVPYEAADINSFAAGGVKMKAGTASQTKGSQVYCIATSSAKDKAFSFKNIGNMIRFTVQKEGVVKATFKGKNGEKISGTVTVNPENGICSSSNLDGDVITIPAAPGENFIALAPGVNLAEGFIITLYGEGDDYLGEVPSSKPLEMDRNKMANLGVIDGWIDNYQLWLHGKSISIAGNKYSKSSTGYDGELLSATTGDYNLFSDLYGKSGVFFLEQSGDYKFTSNTFINIGGASVSCNVYLISRFDNAPVTFKPVDRLTLVDGNFIAKGINFIIRAADYTKIDYLFQTFTKTVFGNLHLEKCGYTVDSNKKQLLGLYTEKHAVGSIRIVDSKIESLYPGMVQLLFANTNYMFLNEIEEVIFDNNVFYNSNTNGALQLFGTAGPAPSEGQQRTIVSITNNTFYNMPPTSLFQSNSLGGLTVKNNLFYAAAVSGTTLIAYSKDTSNEYPYVFDNNICGGAFANLYWFNPYSGVYNTLKKTVAKTTDNMFTTADTENGIFIQAPAFESYGAHQ